MKRPVETDYITNDVYSNDNYSKDIALYATSLEQKIKELELTEQLRLHGVMPEFNSLIKKLIELNKLKYPNRHVNKEFVEFMKEAWKDKQGELYSKIKEMEKELNLA